MENKQNQNTRLQWVEKITRLMDSSFVFPGTNFRFGLDPIIGLVPFLGDGISLIISGLLVSSLWQQNTSGEIKARLLLNIALDFVFGSIPVLGSIWDFYFKANERNLKLVKKHVQEGKYQGSGNGVLLTTGIVVFLILALLIYGIIRLLMWFFEWINQAF